MSEKQAEITQIIWKTTIIESSKQIMIISYSEFYCQVIKVQKINYWIQVWFNYDCDRQIHQKSIFCIISWKNESRKNDLFVQTTHHCKSWNIYKSDI